MNPYVAKVRMDLQENLVSDAGDDHMVDIVVEPHSNRDIGIVDEFNIGEMLDLVVIWILSHEMV